MGVGGSQRFRTRAAFAAIPATRSHTGAVADDGNERKLLGLLGLCARIAANGEPVGSE